MNERHRAIRALLTTMNPRRAIQYVQAFELPTDEEITIIECDIRRRSYAQVCDDLHLSPEAVKRARRRAYTKIADEWEAP